MHHRPPPTVRPSSSLSSYIPKQSRTPSPRMTPLLPSAAMNYPKVVVPANESASTSQESSPTFCGMPLKYLSLFALAIQNAALSITMHYSRVSTPPSQSYSPEAAVFLNELIKGLISFCIGLAVLPQVAERPWRRMTFSAVVRELPWPWTAPFWQLWGEILSPDSWKLLIPAVLYVAQNLLQFVAISNLPVATFQVTYQMKILTTAAFSVALLRRTLSPTKWLSLFFLAFGVGIVQIQTATSGHVTPKNGPVGSAHDSAPLHIHIMSPLKGFAAVTVACVTSGLAGVYFEMVLKNSRSTLWVRNVQLSLASLPFAFFMLLYKTPWSFGFMHGAFRNFGGWAWATVSVQVAGGLVTAVVIKYSDNIMKGFATSLSIVFSFLASVVLFDFRITPSFVIGASTVLCATWMYNQPPGKEPLAIVTLTGGSISDVTTKISGKSTPFPGTPIDDRDPIIGQFPSEKKKLFGRASMSDLLGRSSTTDLRNSLTVNNGSLNPSPWGSMEDIHRYRSSPYGSPYPSRSVSPVPPPPRRTEGSPRVSLTVSEDGEGNESSASSSA
ncbi:unnamed protein product [Mycena citricolor]|uniref:UDP-galactose transporter n=1 Tax=Mycena citricolor TaxID=2018698 RepID=A0AAD2HLY7_9AGAR|nr:unnamed protein product [Mycena citricolor]